MSALYHTNRWHHEYDGDGNCTHVYETDNDNAIDEGFCKVTKYEYGVNGYIINAISWLDNVWQASWNLSKD